MRRWAALLTVFGWWATAQAAPVGLNLALAPGVDTQPLRIMGENSQPDGFLSATASARARLSLGEGEALQLKYELGLKKFLREGSMDLAVQLLDVAWLRQWRGWLLGADASGKLRLSRGDNRDYFDGSAALFAELSPWQGVAARVLAGARKFFYPLDDRYTSSGPTVGLELRWSPTRRLTLSASGQGALAFFEGFARQTDGTDSDQPRRDQSLFGNLNLGYRGPVALQAGYQLLLVRSNSFGESSQRHRLLAAISGQLPLGIFAMLQAAYQFINYPDGIFINQDLLLLDDESQSSVVAKLALPVTRAIDLEVKYGLYWISLPPHSPDVAATLMTYLRQMGTFGLAARW